MEKVSTRSRKALSKKLTSPLWKYEIDPKCIKKESINSKGKGKTRNKNNKVNTLQLCKGRIVHNNHILQN